MSLNTMGRSYTIDFNTLQQINEDTGTARAVQRKVNATAGGSQTTGGVSEVAIAQGFPKCFIKALFKYI